MHDVIIIGRREAGLAAGRGPAGSLFKTEASNKATLPGSARVREGA